MNEAPQQKEMVIASQIVRDVKVGGGSSRAELLRDIARLRAGLQVKNYIPGDKVNCEFKPLSVNDDGTLTIEVFGGMLHGSDMDTSLDPHFHHKVHVNLCTKLSIEQVRSLSLEDLLMKHCDDVSIDDGGNAHNMAIDICLASISALERQKIHLLILTSSDPLKRLPESVRTRMEPMVTYEQLPDIYDRISVQFPWQNEAGKSGTFGLNTEPSDISNSLRALIKSREDLEKWMKKVDTFVTCDLGFQVLKEFGLPGKFTSIVNASTKWRSTIAGLAYGTDLILPMNYKEAADVVHVIKHVGAEEEMHKVTRVPFPSPLKTNGNEIDVDSLRQLDDLIVQLSLYSHQHYRKGIVTFNYPITFEEHGGLIVGSRDRHSIVAFTSTPDQEASNRLIDRYGDSSQIIQHEHIETMGAGDAAAAMVAICNTIDTQEFILPYLEGRETTNNLLHQYAQTIFLSALSRIVGVFLIRTHKTHISNMRLDDFGDLFAETAKASLNAARSLVYSQNHYAIKDLEGLGMKIVTWELGSVVNPLADS